MNPVGWLLFFLMCHEWRKGWPLESEMIPLKFPAPGADGYRKAGCSRKT